MSLLSDLTERASAACELCGSSEGLAAHAVPGSPSSEADGAVLLCAACLVQQEPEATLDANHWFCLQESAWSGVPAVQVLAWRMLHRLQQPWATDLAGQIWMEDEVRAWAEAGRTSAADDTPPVVDCHGAVLQDGDSVTLIKDLVVKGANFTAKRGTMVKNIRLGADPTHVEGRVNKQAIYLKTEFLKKA